VLAVRHVIALRLRSGPVSARSRSVGHGRRWPSLLVLALALAGCGQGIPSNPPTDGQTTDGSQRPAGTESPVASPEPTGSSGSAAGIQVRIARSRLELPSARTRAVALALGSSIFVCGGLTSAGTTTGSIVAIDPASGRVSHVGDLGSPVHDAGGAVLDGSAFIVGGGSLAAVSTVQRVDATGASTSVGRLPAIRADLAAVAVDGEVLVVGGGTPAGPDDRVLATTDGSHFRTVARLPVGVRYPAVATVDGLVYVFGGSTPTGDTRAIQAIDPTTGTVRIVGQLASALSHAEALVVGGAILIVGGRVAGRAEDAVWRFDQTGGRVTRVGRLPYAVSDAAAVVVDGIGYLIGGERSVPIASIIEVTVR
jgi:Kelch motif